MKEAAPFLVFAFFVVLIWLRSRGQPRETPSGEPAPGGPAFRRFVVGNPPVNGPVDAFARFGLWGAWLLGVIAIVGRLTPFLIPAGALFAVIGVLFARNVSGIRERVAERRRRTAAYRGFGGTPRLTPLYGIAMTFVGLVWLTAGVLGALR
ncbi:MAG: hypothetical protein QOH72_5370 [Solirubrobacteraceae bacterium]|nr:hypothetical protein [Solirubrobacteraceae bacterium]